MLSRTVALLATALLVSLSSANSKSDHLDPGWDLAIYVTHPEIRAPLINVTRNDVNLVTPGYWFMAPYANLEATSLGNEYVPFQAGPHIYDSNGELVWSGGSFVDNRNTFAFRATTVHGEVALSFLMDRQRKVTDDPAAVGMILDSSYRLIGRINVDREIVENVAEDPTQPEYDMHEFNIVNSNASLSVWSKAQELDISQVIPEVRKGMVLSKGFRETDIDTGNVTFEWWASDHLSVNESMVLHNGNTRRAWDCFHLNSVDKFPNGDYLVSMRHTSAIYRISGVDGSILWRLGGKLSDFHQDFNFSSQHDAKVVSSNSSVTLLSFLDNGSDDHGRQPSTAITSTIKVVMLYEHTANKTATLLKEFARPDGHLTSKRGQGQLLPNGGVFASWSDKGYISEYGPEGNVVMEAFFASNRYINYRAYKYDFVGHPLDPPLLAAHAYGNDLSTMSSVYHVSWNGATEVVSWTFFGTNNLSQPFIELGNASKSGFETTYIASHFWEYTFAQANAANGTVLGVSNVTEIIIPNHMQVDEEKIALLANPSDEQPAENKADHEDEKPEELPAKPTSGQDNQQSNDIDTDTPGSYSTGVDNQQAPYDSLDPIGYISDNQNQDAPPSSATDVSDYSTSSSASSSSSSDDEDDDDDDDETAYISLLPAILLVAILCSALGTMRFISPATLNRWQDGISACLARRRRYEALPMTDGGVLEAGQLEMSISSTSTFVDQDVKLGEKGKENRGARVTAEEI